MPKTDLILNCATLILKDKGDAALTMRQIAKHTGMSLSNVQYYYKDKDALLIALADRYFGECISELKNYGARPQSGTREQRLRALILFYLDHVEELSDMCRIFRELWAISTRNETLDASLRDYYKEMFDALQNILNPLCDNPEQAASLLVPYFEGYSLTNKALPLSKNNVCKMLMQIISNT